MPLTVTSNFPVSAYGENLADKEALKNRVTELHFMTRLVSSKETHEGKTFPRPEITIGPEHLLHLYVLMFKDPFDLPSMDYRKPLQLLV